MLLKDRVVLIVELETGTGPAIKEKFKENGGIVIHCTHGIQNFSEIESEEKSIDQTYNVSVNILEQTDIQSLFEKIIVKFKKIDILVNDINYTKNDSLEDMQLDTWSEVIDLNLKSLFLVCKSAAIKMKDNNYGRIINISSREWLGSKEQLNFSTAKGGTVSFTRTLALELASHQITANTICEGLMDTDSFRNLPNSEKERLVKMQPTRSIGSANDIANGALYFAADLSSYVTGQTLFIDGGISLFSSLSV